MNELIFIRGGMSLTVKDLENLQAQYPDYRLELVKGKIIVISPPAKSLMRLPFALERTCGTGSNPVN